MADDVRAGTDDRFMSGVPDNGVILDDVSAGTDDRVKSGVPDNGVIVVSLLGAGADSEAISASVDAGECLEGVEIAPSTIGKLAVEIELWRASESLSSWQAMQMSMPDLAWLSEQ